MIRSEQFSQALRALQRLIVHAKAQAYESGGSQLGELLNDLELIPEYVADDRDRTDEFHEMLRGIAQVNPSSRYILEEFERTSMSNHAPVGKNLT